MADNKQERRPQDSSRINIGEDYEVNFWSKKFKVSRERLEKAVKKVGPMITDVQRELGR